MADFPIPSKLAMLTGITDKTISGRIRSTVDAGPPLQRQRYTVGQRQIGVPAVFTSDERATLDAWIASDLQSGTLPFNWIDPVTMLTVSMRFTDDLDYTGNNGGDAQTWSVTMPIEIMP